MAEIANQSELLDEAATAEILQVKTGTLQVWRSTKRYPLPFVKIGRNVRYRRADIDAFIQSRMVGAEVAK